MYIKAGVHSLRATRGQVGTDGHHYMPVHVIAEPNDILRLEFAYDEWLKNEIKAMEGSKWSKENKCWRIADSSRNAFAWQYLSENTVSPYERYDQDYPILEWPTRLDARKKEWNIFKQQVEMLTTIMARRRVILAAEMGTGKTLAVIEAMERAKPTWPIYVTPKYSIGNIRDEYRMWNARVMPEFMSYDGMKNMMQSWPSGRIAPDFIVFDESHNLRYHSSQRSRLAKALADGARKDHRDPYIVSMTGTPAPKDPVNWWMQCEIVCPGFIRESSPTFMKYRLSLIEKKETMAGGVYPEHITWFDNPAKCKLCGQTYEHVNHTQMGIKPHGFVPSENEIDKLYRRLKGLVYIRFKKDCTDLPDKVYRKVQCEPSPAALRAMSLLTKKSPTVIEALTLTRELSDGFQYALEAHGTVLCELCHGNGKMKKPGYVCLDIPIDLTADPQRNIDPNQVMIEVPCTKCNGTGQMPKMVHVPKEVACPKDDALKELLEENEDIGRIVIYAGFTASVDRVARLCVQNGWEVIRVDGRGQWTSFDYGDPKRCVVCGGVETAAEHNTFHPQFHAYRPHTAIEYFQDKDNTRKIAFVGQPGAAGVSITLTAASMLIYYSNTFNGVDRFQSEDRIHRIGMDVNRGATIVDLLHLPTDAYVLDNLQKKKVLQAATMGELQMFLETNYDKA
jgi:hypothetical protein